MYAYSGGMLRTITMSFFVQNWKWWGIFFPANYGSWQR